MVGRYMSFEAQLTHGWTVVEEFLESPQYLPIAVPQARSVQTTKTPATFPRSGAY
jgi:hypothetical protein